MKFEEAQIIPYSVILSVLSNKTNLILGFGSPLRKMNKNIAWKQLKLHVPHSIRIKQLLRWFPKTFSLLLVFLKKKQKNKSNHELHKIKELEVTYQTQEKSFMTHPNNENNRVENFDLNIYIYK